MLIINFNIDKILFKLNFNNILHENSVSCLRNNNLNKPII